MKSKKAKGVTAAGSVALLQGTEAIFFTLLGLFFIKSIFSSPEFVTGELAVKESLCFVILSLVFSKYLKSAFKAIKTKKGFTFAISGMITGMGNMIYIIAVALAGSSYGVILTALYPVFSMLFMRMLFKDRQTRLVWIGAALAVIGGLLFISLPAILNPEEINTKRIIGMVLGVVAACLWALEGIFMKKGSDVKGPTIIGQEVVLIRTAFSALLTLAVLMPVMALPCFHTSGHTSFHWFGQIFTNYKVVLIVLATATSVAVLRLIHIFAIKTIGPKLTAIVDANNFLVPSFISIFLAMTGAQFLIDRNPLSGDYMKAIDLFVPMIWWAWFLVIPIFIGVLMVVYFEKQDSLKKEVIKK